MEVIQFPKISVIVPVYNADKYLRRCIDSIILQNFTDFELLLINDGSKDKSGKICDEYAEKDSRVRVFHKENGGVSSARNLGLDNARGEFVCFCDSDDYANDGWLNTFMTANQKSDIIISGFYEVRQETTTKNVPKRLNFKSAILDQDNSNTLGFLWCKCFKRRIIEKYNIRFNEEYKVWEDLDFILSYATHCNSISISSNCNYYYNFPLSWAKYDRYNKFNCSASIIKNLVKIFGLNENRTILMKYESALFYSLQMYYKKDRNSFTKLRECSTIMNSIRCYPKSYLRLLLNSRFLKVTHIILYLKAKLRP